MSERRPPNNPLSSAEKLAKLYDGLADDVRAGRVEIDEEEKQSAYLSGRGAVDKAIGPSSPQDSTARSSAKVSSSGANKVSGNIRRSWTDIPWITWCTRWFGLHPMAGLGISMILVLGQTNTAARNGRFWPFILAAGIATSAFTVCLQYTGYDRSIPPFAFKVVMASVAVAFLTWLAPVFFVAGALIGFLGLRKQQQPQTMAHTVDTKLNRSILAQPRAPGLIRPPRDDNPNSGRSHRRINKP